MGVAGCIRATTDHEQVGDGAYVDGLYAEALVEYRLALSENDSDAELRGKAAMAALNARDLEAAAEEFRLLGLTDSEVGRDMAADGLVRVANIAIEGHTTEALARALDGLREIAPGRALGSFAGHLLDTMDGLPQDEDALALVTFAAAGATNARTQDSLMLVYAKTLRRLGHCEEAASVYESLARRQRTASIADTARKELALCAVQEGRKAFAAGEVLGAEAWFRKAVIGTANTPIARVAYVGLGDVRLARGDFLGAAESYLRAMEGLLPGDSLYDLASRRLNAIADASVIP